MRGLFTLAAVVAIATLFSEVLAVGLLWYRGQITSATMEDLSAILRGENPESLSEGDAEPSETPTVDDIAEARAMGILNLESREDEVDLLRALLDERAAAIRAEQDKLRTQRTEFEQRLAELEERWRAESTEQARAVLRAQQPADAARALSDLPLDEAVTLLRGLPEKSIARILQEFQRGNDEEQFQRGKDLFQAIADGEPRTSLLNGVADETGDGGEAAP